MSRLKNRINFSVMVLVGVILTVLGVHFYVEMNNFLQNSLSAQGVIVDQVVKSDGMTAPVVEFVDAKGEKQHFTSRSSSKPAKYQVNENVDVVYVIGESGRKLEAYIYDSWDIRIRRFGVLAFGLMFVSLGIIFGRIFWNRDSMYIGVAFSKTFAAKERETEGSRPTTHEKLDRRD